MRHSSAIKAGLFIGVLFILGVGGSTLSFGQSTEFDTDRPGSDFRNFDLPQASPDICQAECARDTRCKAWTYVKPGVQGRNARCWLKSIVPRPIRSTCCISGVKTTQLSPQYLGCYKDQGDPTGGDLSRRDLNGLAFPADDMTNARCIAACRSEGYAYAGTQYGRWCFCGNSYGRSGTANNCNTPCSGNRNETCGGAYANSIYAVGPVRPTPVRPALGSIWDTQEYWRYEWTGVWTRRGQTNVFDAGWTHPTHGRVTAVLTINIQGSRVYVERRDTTGPQVGRGCQYQGTLAASRASVSGTYSCEWDRGPYPWRAIIR